MHTIRDFVHAMWNDWLARMSGPLSVPAAALAYWISNDAAKIGFVLTAFACLWVTAYRVWKPEHEKVQALEHRLTPRFDLSYDANDRVCKASLQFGEKMVPGTAFWIRVENTGQETISGCEARLVEVHKAGCLTSFLQ